MVYIYIFKLKITHQTLVTQKRVDQSPVDWEAFLKAGVFYHQQEGMALPGNRSKGLKDKETEV